jgi:tRNA pseudouridine55 synthase
MERSAHSVNGIVVIDKPEGITSYDVVRRLKGLLSGVKIGFLGTLDPLATGVLPLLLGEGTKLATLLETGHKVYEATLHLGVITDTWDREGQVLQLVDLDAYNLSPRRIEDVIQRFRGRIQQLPPMYSALKHKGEPLYKLARRGEEAARSLREVEIYKLEATEIDPPSLHLHIECSKGTYIRALAHDIGRELGCGAHVVALRRTSSGPFNLEAAFPLAEVERLFRGRQLKQRVIPLAQAVGFLPLIEVGEADALQISNGQIIPVAGIDQKAKQAIPQGGRKEVPQGVPQVGRKEERKKGEVVRVVAREGGGLVAVGEIYLGATGLVLKPLRVFRDDVFTKRPPYGKDTMHTMVNQGGR